MYTPTQNGTWIRLLKSNALVKDGAFYFKRKKIHIEDLTPLTYPTFFNKPNGKLDYCGYYLNGTNLIFSFSDAMETVSIYEEREGMKW